MIIYKIFLFFFINNYYYYMNCEVFTSTGHLLTLIDSINGVAETMEKFLKDEYERLMFAKNIFNEFRQMSNLANKDPEKFIGNPVNAFLMIKTLNKDLQFFVDGISNYNQINELVDNVKNDNLFPTSEDYTGAATALHRLEDTYNLAPSDIRKGNLSQQYPSRELTVFECFELGRISYEQKDYYHTIRWMTESLELINKSDSKEIDRFKILDYLSFSTAQQGNLREAIDLTKQMLIIDPSHNRAQANLLHYEQLLREELKKTGNKFIKFKNERPPSPYPEREIYEALCRGESIEIPPKRLKNLKCRYVNHSPFLRISPVKEEKLFDRPEIWIYHDVITNEQIEIMKELGSPKLQRAIVRSPITGEYVTADYRISKSGWLNDSEHPHLRYLTKLVNSITNLSLSTAEEWQIANYGIGGQYEPHFDFARKSEPDNAFHSTLGNRIATWLFYLEAPEKGGSTVFPTIGVNIQPKRRSAAFWFNLLRSGDGDFKTRHAACPVLFGSKWVSNKWIHSVGQELIRPCGLIREETEDM